MLPDVQPAATADINEQFDYLSDAAGLEVATRFILATQQTIRDLNTMPGLGFAHPTRALPDLRQWRVKDFPKILIFYRLTETGIQVVRVLHGARDIDTLLDADMA